MDEVLRQGAAVGGEYAVTGTLPTLADVEAFTGTAVGFDHGYYRFVSHPYLRRIESSLKERFRCRHCRLAESPEMALLELLLCLRDPGKPFKVLLLNDGGTGTPTVDATFLPPAERDGVTILAPDPAEPAAALPGRGDAAILFLADGAAVPSSILERARQASGSGAYVVVYLATLPGAAHALPAIPGARFHVVGLHAGLPGGRPPVHGGAVLGTADRVMDRLALQMRRRGPVLSSRAAQHLLGGGDAGGHRGGTEQAPPAGAADLRVAETLRRWEGGTSAFLYASGMSAITRVLDVLRVPGRSQVVAVGHLFNDTYNSLRLAPRPAHEAANCFLGVDELDALDGCVGDQTAAILTETITNPLSDVPDLAALSRVARARGVPLVVDNTLATPENSRPIELGADIVIHSTTKFMNGRNDHGGGAVILSDERTAGLLADRRALWQDGMSPLEAEVLERNLPTLPGRMRLFNANAGRVAAMLAGHPGVARLYFNGHPSHRSYATARRMLRGPGSVLSFTLADGSRETLRAFYDSPLDGIRKAPSLGSDETLLCPYTLLTHHDDTDEVLDAIGLPRCLLRIAVGCEESIEPALEALDDALRRSVGRR